MEKNMNQSEAIKILIKAVQVAQKKGVYSLDEAYLIHKAVLAFVNQYDDNSGKNINNSAEEVENL